MSVSLNTFNSPNAQIYILQQKPNKQIKTTQRSLVGDFSLFLFNKDKLPKNPDEWSYPPFQAGAS